MSEPTSRIKLFIRQPFTESANKEQKVVEEVLAVLTALDGHPHTFHYLTGCLPQREDTFRQDFTHTTGQTFTPTAFRRHRIALLARADLVVNIRVAMSESTAFELGHHYATCRDTPLLFLVWAGAPIKTTLLQNLGTDVNAFYIYFEDPDDLRAPMKAYFEKLRPFPR